MAKGKPTPEKSKIDRARPPLAYSRARKGDEGDKPAGEAKPADEAKAEAKPPEARPAEAPPPPDNPAPEAPAPTAADAAEVSAATITPPKPTVEPWPDATPLPMKPVDPPSRARSETIAMPPELAVGAPPAVPGSVEEPTWMPAPKDVPGAGGPTDAALPPGHVPAGDSRSLRRGTEFALIYRQGSAVVTRFGTVGQRGQWRVVEYPTPASASTSFAKEVSRFVGDGFTDYRD